MNLKSFGSEVLLGFLVPALTFVVIAALVPLAIKPQLDQITQTSRDLKVKEARLRQLEKKLAALEALNEEELNDKVAKAEIALPSGKGLAPLIEGIKKLSSESSLVLSSIKLKPGKIATISAEPAERQTQNNSRSQTSGRTVQLPNSRFDLVFQVELAGKFSDFQKFLDLVEKAKRILLVVDFSASQSATGTNTFAVIMNAPFRSLPRNFEDVAAEELPLETEEGRNLLETLEQDFTEYTREVSGSDCKNCTGVENPFP